jgi:hypothetical protein
MALLNEADLRSLAGSRASRAYDSTSDALQKSIKASAALSAFTIFLSHSYLDKTLILGITEYLEKMGYVVYVDWREDTQLSRDNVTKETAALVRTRIMQSASLFFATTDSAKDSKWMPWELGYMDGKKGKSAILQDWVHVLFADKAFQIATEPAQLDVFAKRKLNPKRS